MLKPVFYTVMWAVLFFWSCGIYHQMRTDDTLRSIDSVPIRLSEWQPLYVETAVVHTVDMYWTIPNCTDLSQMSFPSVTYANASNTPGAGCVINFGMVSRGTNTEVVLMNPPTSGTGCTPGTYPLKLAGPVLNTTENRNAVVAGYANLVVNATNGPNNVRVQMLNSASPVIGNGIILPEQLIQSCKEQRANTVTAINTAAGCAQEVSPFCSCVHHNTMSLNDTNAVVLVNKDTTLKMLENCRKISRYSYNREKNLFSEPILTEKNMFNKSTMLFAFLLAMFFNSLRETIVVYWLIPSKASWVWDVSVTVFFVLLFTFLVPFVLQPHSMGVWLFWIFVAFVPALAFTVYWHLVMPSFDEQDEHFKEKDQEKDAKDERSLLPHLHPFFFDMGLCALMLFTLITRGVVEKDALIIALMKCHAITALYIALTWYNIHRRKLASAFDDIFVQEAYIVMVSLVVAASSDHLIIPYATKECVQLHWFLPLLFALAAFAPSTWVGTMHKGGIQAGTDLPSTLPFVVGILVLAVMASKHTVLYGNVAGHYPHATWITTPAHRLLLHTMG